MKSTIESVVPVDTSVAPSTPARRVSTVASLCQYRARKNAEHEQRTITTAPAPRSLRSRARDTTIASATLLCLLVLWPVAKLAGAFDGVDADQGN